MKKNIMKIIPMVALATAVITTNVFAGEGKRVTLPLVIGNGEDMSKEADNSIYIDGEKLEKALIERNGTINFPAREVFEKLGYKVSYNGEAKVITIAKGPHFIKFDTKNDAYSFLKMPKKSLGQAPIVIDGVTYVPTTLLTEVMAMPNVELIKGEAGKKAILSISTKTPRIVKTEIKDIDKENNTITILDENGMETILTLGDETKIEYKKGEKEFKIGQKIEVQLNEAQTMSLPPINNPIYIKAVSEQKPEMEKVTGKAIITAVDKENERITVKDEKMGKIILNLDNPDLEVEFKDMVGDYMINWVKEGQKLEIEYSPMMTRSLPPINNPIKITVII